MNPFRPTFVEVPVPKRAPDVPNVLLCVSIDPRGGGGLFVDTRVASMLGCRPLGVMTAVIGQTRADVLDFDAMDADIVRGQLDAVVHHMDVHAVTIGMLGSSPNAHAIVAALAFTDAPVVWDPIVHPTRRDTAIVGSLDDALAALGPRLTLVTPNTQELAVLTRREVADLDSAIAAAESLVASLRVPVLVTGGHLGGEDAIDVLVQADSREVFRAPRVARPEKVHGTGCALSTAIASQLAKGATLVEAIHAAKEFVTERLAKAIPAVRGLTAIV